MKKSKVTEQSKKIDWLSLAPFLCAFIIPIFIMIGIFVERGIFPFGDSSFLRTDLYHQYAPFFQTLKDKLANGGSLSYTWELGMGTNYAALFAYYLSSPLNWLLVFCPQKYVIEFITYMIVLKIGLSGLTFTYYLSKRNNTKNIGIAFFGIFYALSGYMAAYSWNIMWLDCILLFPLIILGIDRLVKEDKCMLYCLTLGLSIISNYYISIMICIYLVIYFIVSMILLPSKEKKTIHLADGTTRTRTIHTNYPRKILNFCIYSLLAGGLAAAVLIPEIYALQMTASSDFNFPKTFTSYFSIFDMIARHLVNVKVHIGLDHWPNIYCGVAILMLIPLYVMNKKVNYKEKAAYLLLLLFFFLSFSLNALNFIWHGLHYPNSLPARQSFIYIFLVLVMAYKGYEGIKERSMKQIVGSMWIVIAFILLAEKLCTDDTFYSWSVFYLSILFVVIYGLFAYLHRKGGFPKDILAILTVSVIALEAAINTSETSVTTVNRVSYVQDDESVRTMIEAVEEEEGNNFFRVEKLDRRTKNDGAWYGFQSGSIFSSTANANLTSFYKKFGLEGSTNAYSINGETFLVNSLFSIKYGLTKSEEREDNLRTLYKEEGNMKLYQNNYTLPLGFMTPLNLDDTWDGSGYNPIENQNSFIRATTGINGLFYPVNSTSLGTTTTTIKISEPGYVYAYVKGNDLKNVTATWGEESEKFENIDRGYILDLGYHVAGDEITLTTTDQNASSMTVYAYQMDEDKFIDAYNSLNQDPMIIDSYDDTHINAHIDVTDSGLLFTSIPYEKGWTVKVDGEEVEIEAFEDTFISIPITTGSHTLEFSYQPEGQIIGIIITLGSVTILILLFFLNRLFDKKEKRHIVADNGAEEEPMDSPEITSEDRLSKREQVTNMIQEDDDLIEIVNSDITKEEE